MWVLHLDSIGGHVDSVSVRYEACGEPVEPPPTDRTARVKPRVIVVCSDQHCGSTLGLATPEPIQLDNENWYRPGRPTLHLWEQHLNFVDDASEVIKKWRKKGATAHYINLGDVTDGDHHHTYQIASKDQGVHIAIARNVLLDGFLRLEFDTIHAVMGTPAHVGISGGLEKSIFSDIESSGYPVIRDPRTGRAIWREMQADLGAYRFDFKHHSRSGTRQHTEKSYQAIYAYDIHGSYLNDGRRPPDVAVRAHKHRINDSGPDHRGVTRVVTSGCWQYSSEWIKSKAFESEPHFGGWVFVVTDEMRGPYDLWAKPFKYPHPQHEANVWRP